MLLTRRMERAGLAPLGFVATDYVLGIWSAHQPVNIAALFDEDMLGDDLEAWMAESSMLKRTFRNVAVIAGLIERHHPGAEKTRRQVTLNSDLIYDVLRKHQPDHILLRATRADAAGGLTDVGRVAGMLARVKGRIVHMALSASRRWRCRCCWRSAAKACAPRTTRRSCWPRPRRSSPKPPERRNRRTAACRTARRR